MAAVLLWRRGGAPVWVAVLVIVVFGATFVRTAVAGRDTLRVHVPGALVVGAGAVWLAAWACTPVTGRRGRPAARRAPSPAGGPAP